MQSNERLHRLWTLRGRLTALLVMEASILLSIGLKYHRSWGDDVIGLAVLATALLMPSVISLIRIVEVPHSGTHARRLANLLFLGIGFGLFIPSVAFLAGDHGAAPIVMLGLVLQAAVHTVAARRLGQLNKDLTNRELH